MRVEYLFSSNKKWGSKVIAWAASFEDTGLSENPSHVAVLLDGEWVYESTFTSGVRIVPYEEWLKINDELYRIPCVVKSRDHVDVTAKAKSLWGRSYDWMGIAFFIWRYLGLIVLGRPLPRVNRWESKDKHFCTEFMAKLTGANYSMKSPAKVCAEFLKDKIE